MNSLLQHPKRVLAVDPGKSGAVCLLGRGLFKIVRDFKTLQQIAVAIHQLASMGSVDYAVMEFVHAMPGQGVVSMFSFGRASGVADGALALSLPALQVEQIAPQAWQKYFRDRESIPREQEFDSRQIASKIFPLSAPQLLRIKDHNSADSILMAIWKLENL